ncbi:hypothetical protein ACLG6S_10915 [Thermodesulfobacteriota bacterium B35]
MNLRATQLSPSRPGRSWRRKSSTGLLRKLSWGQSQSGRSTRGWPGASTLLLSCLLLLLLPAPALAVQIHGGAEGLVSHQIGHLLFLTGMGYLLWRLRRRNLQGAGWRPFRLFLCCIILWNITTITGHWLDEIIPPARFLRNGSMITSFRVTDLPDLLFYATRLDHFLLVPAFLFLLSALQRWSRHT